MSALRESTSSNFADVKKIGSWRQHWSFKTLSFAFTVSEIDFELTVLTVQDATPVPVTSSTPMRNMEKPVIDLDETKNSDTSKELLQLYTKEIENLRNERDNALEKIKALEKKHLSYENLKENHAKFKYYTRINMEVFDCLFDYLQAEKDIEAVKKTKKGSHRLFCYRDQLIMILIELRLNTQFENLADQVGCSETTVHDIFKKWINLMYVKLKFLIKWTDHDASMQTLPNVFRQYFPKLKTIIDCTEIFINRPKTYKVRVQAYSNYKKYSTVKFLTVCTPLSSISFHEHGVFVLVILILLKTLV